MLPLEDRQKKIKFVQHIFGKIKECKYLFPIDANFNECYTECVLAIRDRMKGIIVKDNRYGQPGINSNYICIFVGATGHIIAVPCYIDDVIVPLTIKDVRRDFSNPNWFVDRYNEIAETRDMQKLNHVVRTINDNQNGSQNAF